MVSPYLSFTKTSKLIYKSVQKEAVGKGILHCNVSPFNVLIEDLVNKIQGMLIDWEFAVEITFEQEYGIGGTVSIHSVLDHELTLVQGTIPFLSIGLLEQICDGLQRKNLKGKCSYKEGNVVSVQLCGDADEDFSVRHVPTDDMESLFYVFIWILVLYDGPLGWE